MTIKTFAELEEEKPSAARVLGTLRSYISEGSRISPEVTLRVISNARLSRQQLETARGYLHQGSESLRSDNRNPGDASLIRIASEYELVENGIDRLLINQC